MSEEVLSKLKQADIKLLSTRAKTEMARMLSSWFEANIGKESKDQGDIRCVADRLIAEVIEEDAQGEYVVFANNYIAFLILECEYDTARALLEAWVRKAKAHKNLEWRVLLYASFAELIVRSTSAGAAYSKVSKIHDFVARHVEGEGSNATSSPTIAKSYCSIMINHAKLMLAVENGEDSLERVKEVLDRARRVNEMHSTDETIEKIIRKIETVFEPETGKSQLDGGLDGYSDELRMKGGGSKKETESAYLKNRRKISELGASKMGLLESPKGVLDKSHMLKNKSKSPDFRIIRAGSRSPKTRFAPGTRFAFESQSIERRSIIEEVQKESESNQGEGDFERFLGSGDIQILKDATLKAMEGLKELRANKDMILQFQQSNAEMSEKEGKLKLLTKLIKYEKAIEKKKNELKDCEEKIEAIERFYISKTNQTGELPNKIQSSNKVPIQEISNKALTPSRYTREIGTGANITSPKVSEIYPQGVLSETTAMRISPSENQIHVTQAPNGKWKSDNRLSNSHGKPQASKDLHAFLTETSPMALKSCKQDLISSSDNTVRGMNDIQGIFFASYCMFKLTLESKDCESFSGKTNHKSVVIVYSIVAKKSENGFDFIISMNDEKNRSDTCTNTLKETQFLAFCMAALQDDDNYLNLKSTLPFAVVFKYCIASKMKVISFLCKIDKKGGYQISKRNNSLINNIVVRILGFEFDVFLQHLKELSCFLLTFRNIRM